VQILLVFEKQIGEKKQTKKQAGKNEVIPSAGRSGTSHEAINS